MRFQSRCWRRGKKFLATNIPHSVEYELSCWDVEMPRSIPRGCGANGQLLPDAMPHFRTGSSIYEENSQHFE